VNGVGNDRAHDDDGRFSAALRCNVVGLDEKRLDFRYTGEARYLVAVEVRVENLPASKENLLG
jgi:hypothetical protein